MTYVNRVRQLSGLARSVDRVTAATGRPRGRRSGATVPVEFDSDPVVWVAWLYYEESLTQEEVATRLGMSRASVIGMLREARARGVVTISIASTHLQSIGLSRTVAARFGLNSCLVIPDNDGAPSEHDRVGWAGARLLSERLQSGDVLGVSWGRTVLALANALPARAVLNLTAVQVTGSFVGTPEMSAELCTSTVANRTGARCVYLHAPGLVSDPRVKTMLLREPNLREQFRILGCCTRIVFGVGHLKASSTVFRSGYLERADAAPYVARGAVGVVAGRFLDAGGGPVIGALDERMIGMDLAALARIPDRICVAAGTDKAVAIAATLRGGLATDLVTDAATARALLRQPGQAGGDSV